MIFIVSIVSIITETQQQTHSQRLGYAADLQYYNKQIPVNMTGIYWRLFLGLPKTLILIRTILIVIVHSMRYCFTNFCL